MKETSESPTLSPTCPMKGGAPAVDESAADAVAKAACTTRRPRTIGVLEEQARALDWDTEWEQVLDRQPPFAKWFVGGKLEVAVNCLDRHVEAGNGDGVASAGRAARR